MHRHLSWPKSGKTSLILEQCRGVFKRIYIFSPSIGIDDSWIPVKKYIEQDLALNTERELGSGGDYLHACLYTRILTRTAKENAILLGCT